MHNKWTVSFSSEIPGDRHMRTIENANQPGPPLHEQRHSPVAVPAHVTAG
ncbi:MAG: hypothetical protein L0Z73_15180 [Gammaproteobacteria bacterium]|nr:hypothetical protein [Gammaproteobacteria bacterium]